ncbi:MAG: hypothetical protein WCL16_07670 [bacterium]
MIVKVKTIGNRNLGVLPDAVSSHRRALVLTRQMEKLNPNPKPRGFVFKARTWRDYEIWRASQINPRLW